MRIWIDTEFNGFGGELLSMALVAENGHQFYFELEPTEPFHPWVLEHVVPLFEQTAISRQQLPAALALWLSQFPTVHLVADWPDDIRYFCEALITAPGERINTPPLTMEIRRDLDCDSLVPHHALHDARAIMRRHLQVEGGVDMDGDKVEHEVNDKAVITACSRCMPGPGESGTIHVLVRRNGRLICPNCRFDWTTHLNSTEELHGLPDGVWHRRPGAGWPLPGGYAQQDQQPTPARTRREGGVPVMALPHRYYINPEQHALENEAETCVGCVHNQLVKGVERCQHPDVKTILALKRCADFEEKQ